MCIQILKTKIIPKRKYLDYIGANVTRKKLEYAMQTPDLTLLKIKFAYKGYTATIHVLTESDLLSESAEYINNKIKKIALDWAMENFYEIEPYGDIEENQKIIVH